MKQLHLICNAHVDPVWLWDLEEGISAAISTFRTAADFCEQYDGFVFNHNEALLYEWIEELEPALFARIQKLVREGKWHIMGGWYLQPDCNLPSGESLIRQIAVGRRYFAQKFHVVPETAINFDPFGHSLGLVQILAKSGFTSYLFCRPGQGDCPLPDDTFIWEGPDGSRVMAHRADTYGTLLGEAGGKIREWLAANREKPWQTGCFLWGVGNHGGGPSRKDLQEIRTLAKELEGEVRLVHSTPEAYFAERKAWNEKEKREEAVVTKDLNAWAVGCYTSQIRIKQKHRQLEGALDMAEKMASQAALAGLMTYPEEELARAEKALLLCEFHDILPGTSIQSAEEKSLRTLDYGLEIAEKWKRCAFFHLLRQEARAEEGEYPLCIYNPHPFVVEGDFCVEFQLANQNWSDRFAMPVIVKQGKTLPSQVEKEACNLNLDWRKRVVFHAALQPASMNRFSAFITMQETAPEKKESKACRIEGDHILFDNGCMQAAVNRRTGLLDQYRLEGKEYVRPGSLTLSVRKTDCDPWGMNRKSYQEQAGHFTLLDETEGSRYSGVSNERHAGEGAQIPSVRIVEDGEVRTVIEAVLGYGQSRACMQYVFSRQGRGMDLNLRLHWEEKGRFLKLELPTLLEAGSAEAEIAYGRIAYPKDGTEKVCHRYCGLWEAESDRALTVYNQGNYGVDFRDGTIGISLLHAAVYSAHPIGDRPLLVQDRFLPYIDQGERTFSFHIQAGACEERKKHAAREALVFQEAPMAIAAFPDGDGIGLLPVLTVDPPSVLPGAFRKMPGEAAYVVRLFESCGEETACVLHLLGEEQKQEICLSPFEIKTLRYEPGNRTLKECGLLGEARQ